MADPASAPSVVDSGKLRAADEEAATFELRDDACKQLSPANQCFCTEATLKVWPFRVTYLQIADVNACLIAHQILPLL